MKAVETKCTVENEESNCVTECMWCSERSLLAWLHYNKVDQITDDEEFMMQEAEVIKDFCKKRKFEISEEDMKTIRGRGLEESFDEWKCTWEEQNGTI